MVVHEAMTSQCGSSVIQVQVARVETRSDDSVDLVLVVRMDLRVMAYEAITPQFGRSVVQVLDVRLDIGVVTYEAMTRQCGRSVVQVLVVTVGVVSYEAMTPQCGRSVVQVRDVRFHIMRIGGSFVRLGIEIMILLFDFHLKEVQLNLIDCTWDLNNKYLLGYFINKIKK